MPPKRTSTSVWPRSIALVAVLVILVTTAACGSVSSGSRPPDSTPGPSAPLAPWRGTLAASTLPAPVQSLRAVTCATARRCWAVGSTSASASAPAGPALVATTDGGVTWLVQTIPAAVGYLSGIACATARICTAVGQVGQTGVGPGTILTTRDAGTTWVLQTVPVGTTDVTAVDCQAAGPCRALAVVSGQVTTLSPPTSGTSWTARGALPAVASVATGLSCTDAAHCWATATQMVDVGHVIGIIAATADGGATWSLQHVPAGTGALQGIDCLPGPSSNGPAPHSRTGCAAVGTTATVLGGARSGRGVVVTSANGGATWSSAPVTSTAADFLAVSCGAGPCVAVGTTVATAPQGGVVALTASAAGSASAWRQAAVAPVALPLTGVSCVTLAACVMVGESVSAHLSGG